MIYRESTLCHFNPNHDPDNGQFTSKNKGLTSEAKKMLILGAASVLATGAIAAGSAIVGPAGALTLPALGAAISNGNTVMGGILSGTMLGSAGISLAEVLKSGGGIKSLISEMGTRKMLNDGDWFSRMQQENMRTNQEMQLMMQQHHDALQTHLRLHQDMVNSHMHNMR